jgi:hypothetical protein
MRHGARALRPRTQSTRDRSGRQRVVLAGSATGTPVRLRACRLQSFLVQSSEQLTKSDNHLRRRAHVKRRADQDIDRPQLCLLQAERFTDTALDPVALGGSGGVLAGNQDPQPWLSAFALLQVKGVSGEIVPLALPQQALELDAAPQAAGGIQSEALARRGYNPSRRRPLARRLRRTLRPPGVRLRTRKP